MYFWIPAPVITSLRADPKLHDEVAHAAFRDESTYPRIVPIRKSVTGYMREFQSPSSIRAGLW